MVASRCQCLLAVGFLAVTCDGDDDRRFGQFLPEPRGDLVPVQTGQTEIEQDKTWLLTAGDLDGFDPIAGDLHVSAQLFEPPCHRLCGIAIVVDNEDSVHLYPTTGGKHHSLGCLGRAKSHPCEISESSRILPR